MDQKPKANRDLSDLKAKLGLAKPSPAAPAQPGPVGAPPAPGAAVHPPGGVAAPPEPSRDPFAMAQPAVPPTPYASIVDAGPAIDIPKEKRSITKWLIGFLAIAVIFLGVGYAGGKVSGARMLYNRTIEDASRIKDEVEKIVGYNKKIVQAIVTTRQRNKAEKQFPYDGELIEEMEGLLVRNSPELLNKQQQRLFQTNYAMMKDNIVTNLFKYYNGSIRLADEIKLFLQQTKQNKSLIETYVKETGTTAQRNYGIVLYEDKGTYFLGSVVEVGMPVCKDKNAKPGQCPAGQLAGFNVRTGGGNFSMRPGKEIKNKAISDFVIPIVPDQNWKQLIVGKKGYLAYKQYVAGLRNIQMVSAWLTSIEGKLVLALTSESKRKKIFTF